MQLSAPGVKISAVMQAVDLTYRHDHYTLAFLALVSCDNSSFNIVSPPEKACAAAGAALSHLCTPS